MFSLSKEDLGKRLFDCAGGPASFNDDLTRLGGKVVSIDPAYQFPPEEIRRQIGEAHKVLRRFLTENRDFYSLDIYANSIDEYCQVHLAAMNDFLSDLPCDETRRPRDGRSRNRHEKAERTGLSDRESGTFL